MSKVARNALKGYTFQNYVFTLFLAKMDVERKIIEIESESIDTQGNFDDLYLKMLNGVDYRIQVKNYPDIEIDEITISDEIVRIKTNENKYNNEDNNILIVNTNSIATDTYCMGLPALIKKGITIISLTEESMTTYLDNLYRTENREVQIIQKAYEYICMGKFEISISDLPELIKLSTDLQEQTVIMRKVPDKIKKGLTYIVGKPGVGKSHFVNELIKFYPDALTYRFWIGSHDKELRNRLSFNKFLTELGLLVFKSPRNFTIEEIIAEIIIKNEILIIDGLDHVENYNPKELQQYIKFISDLGEAKARILVLSRPLKENTTWESKELLNWNMDETRFYLQVAYDISGYNIQKNIFDITNGYPIITYFLAEHYKQHDDINLKYPITDLDKYYDNLISKIGTKSLLCIFATNNSFFTWKELATLLPESELYDSLKEFIYFHPYLFIILENRISLIHDSFNTYLREILISFPVRENKVLRTVKSSLMVGEVEYMARLSSFDFEDSFLIDLLKKYSDFNNFKMLLNSTLDFNSITSFYEQLKVFLETHYNILEIYQYYSFSLIYQVATRNDLIGFEGLIYQVFLYIHNRGKVENEIFSSGIMWYLYLACKQKENHTEKFIRNSLYSEQQFYGLIDSLNEETSFFEKLDKQILFSDIETKLLNPDFDVIKKADLVEEYLVSIFIHDNSEETFYNLFIEYIDTEKGCIFFKVFRRYGFSDFWIQLILKGAKNKIHELGMFEEENIYRGITLKEKIMKHSSEGSFDVVQAAQSLIRLANYESRDIDIYSINYVWTMYEARKDYSVYSIDDSLIIFEDKSLLQAEQSIELISRLMEQSEKGIRHLLSSYINKKGPEFTKILIKKGYFDNPNFNVNIFDLSSENINCLTKEIIILGISDMLCSHRVSKKIEYEDISNILKSSYCYMILDALEFFKYTLVGTVNGDIINKEISKRDIDYISKDIQLQDEYTPFKNGYINEEDENYIIKNNIPALALSKYTDGWHSCLPFPKFYRLYDNDIISKDYLNILHKSMFARIVDERYVGNWYLLIGNILKILIICEIEVDWEKLFIIFKQFLDVSLIYFPETLD